MKTKSTRDCFWAAVAYAPIFFLSQTSLSDICRVGLFRPMTSSDRVKVSHPPPLLGNWVYWRNNDILWRLMVFSFASDSGGSLEWRIHTSASRILVVRQLKVVALQRTLEQLETVSQLLGSLRFVSDMLRGGFLWRIWVMSDSLGFDSCSVLLPSWTEYRTRCMWRLGPVRWFCLSQSTVD